MTEDMELSHRCFSFGYSSLFIDKPYGFSMPPNNFHSFKSQHYRWNFGNSQIYRDFFLRQSALNFRNKLIYFITPGIYINTYFLPFLSILCFLVISDVYNFNVLHKNACTIIIISVFFSELLGEFVMLLFLGKMEKVGIVFILRNYISWWALTLTNSLSTLHVLIKRKIAFSVTSKASVNKEVIVTRFLYYLELLPFILISALFAIHLLFSPQVDMYLLIALSFAYVFSLAPLVLVYVSGRC